MVDGQREVDFDQITGFEQTGKSFDPFKKAVPVPGASPGSSEGKSFPIFTPSARVDSGQPQVDTQRLAENQDPLKKEFLDKIDRITRSPLPDEQKKIAYEGVIKGMEKMGVGAGFVRAYIESNRNKPK